MRLASEAQEWSGVKSKISTAVAERTISMSPRAKYNSPSRSSKGSAEASSEEKNRDSHAGIHAWATLPNTNIQNTCPFTLSSSREKRTRSGNRSRNAATSDPQRSFRFRLGRTQRRLGVEWSTRLEVQRVWIPMTDVAYSCGRSLRVPDRPIEHGEPGRDIPHEVKLPHAQKGAERGR
jgi:hypothetical protein